MNRKGEKDHCDQEYNAGTSRHTLAKMRSDITPSENQIFTYAESILRF